MEDQEQEKGPGRSHGSEADQRSAPVRSRWTPKPEQILLLESIFNSGMVNPSEEETVGIRKQLENFGPVGDANVFYWFQNRRSRSRRRQRQIRASLRAAVEQPQALPPEVQYENSMTLATGFANNTSLSYPMNMISSPLGGSGSSSPLGLCGSDDLYPFSGHPFGLQELQQSSYFDPQDNSSFRYQSGALTVFINGVATEVGRGPLDTKAMFGEDLVLLHSSGVPAEVHGLQHGESYFLVPRA